MPAARLVRKESTARCFCPTQSRERCADRGDQSVPAVQPPQREPEKRIEPKRVGKVYRVPARKTEEIEAAGQPDRVRLRGQA